MRAESPLLPLVLDEGEIALGKAGRKKRKALAEKDGHNSFALIEGHPARL
jgi:hypothetical protein